MLLLDDIKSQRIPAYALQARKLLITGPIGVGKTTAAKALAARAMGVEGVMQSAATNRPKLPEDRWDISEAFPFDFRHINGADDGIDKIRELAVASRQSPTDPQAQCRAFVVDEIHALPDKAVQALLLPLEQDTRNIWIACTSRPAGQLDAALRSRFSCHLQFGAADVAAVLTGRGVDASSAARAAKRAQGDMRLALGGSVDGDAHADDASVEIAIRTTNGRPRLVVDARRLHALAIRSPYATQASILDAVVDVPDVHTAMCVTLSPRNDIAAHQLVAAARKAGLL